MRLQTDSGISAECLRSGEVVLCKDSHSSPRVDRAACVAIEDSPTGVRSAVAAGVPTLAVPHVVPVPSMVGAVQVPSLRGLTPRDLRTLFVAGRSAEVHGPGGRRDGARP